MRQKFRDRKPIVLLIGKTAAHRLSCGIGYRDVLRVHHSSVLCVDDLGDRALGKLDDMLTGPYDLHLDHCSACHAVEWRIAIDHLVENAAQRPNVTRIGQLARRTKREQKVSADGVQRRYLVN